MAVYKIGILLLNVAPFIALCARQLTDDPVAKAMKKALAVNRLHSRRSRPLKANAHHAEFRNR